VPDLRDWEIAIIMLDGWNPLQLPYLPLLVEPPLLLLDPLEQHARRLVVRILRHQLPANRGLEDQLAEPLHPARRVGDDVEQPMQRLGRHATTSSRAASTDSRASPSSRRSFSRVSCTCARSAVYSSSSSSGSRCSSPPAFGFFRSRL